MYYSKFDQMIDTEAYNKEFSEIEKNGGKREYAEVPEGTYEAKIMRLELSEDKNGKPMAKIAFVILNGQYKGQWMFGNFNLIYPLATHNLNELLKQMNTDVDITWDGSFVHYGEMLADVLEEVGNKIGFVVTLTKTQKDGKVFSSYSIDDGDDASWELSDAEMRLGAKRK